MDKPNILFILVDQLRAASLPIYGERQIETPYLDRLAREGVVFDHAISSCPVCTPYRAMLLTGRHPQTTGMVVNFARIRHDEIGFGDVFSHAGYRTGWIGKWHLHTGAFPHLMGPDFVPDGRDRLGFDFWRGYNFHMQYFDGWVNNGDWRNERWKGYETDALAGYALGFLADARRDGQPFCLVLSPHQPHNTPAGEHAPAHYYARLPPHLEVPANVAESRRTAALEMYRHYLAMTLALDDMVGRLLDYLDDTGLAGHTLVVFTSDHGTQGGAHDIHPWLKKVPYEESIRVPLIVRLPRVLPAGVRRDTLVTPVDFLPTLCHLCAVPVPRTVEGHDLAAAWRGVPGAPEPDAVLTMNFTAGHDYLVDGDEWRGVRTKTHSYCRWLSGRRELYDLRADPLQRRNLVDTPAAAGVQEWLEQRLEALMAKRGDTLAPCHTYADWFDSYRRVIRNAFGPLGDPEDTPDWSLLG